MLWQIGLFSQFLRQSFRIFFTWIICASVNLVYILLLSPIRMGYAICIWLSNFDLCVCGRTLIHIIAQRRINTHQLKVKSGEKRKESKGKVCVPKSGHEGTVYKLERATVCSKILNCYRMAWHIFYSLIPPHVKISRITIG